MKLEGGLKLIGGDLEGLRPNEVVDLPNTVVPNQLLVKAGALRFAKKDSSWATIKTFYTGPGPTKLIAGDTSAGYFGSVSASDFITGDALDAAIGMNYGNDPGNSNIGWLKFQHSGKVLFVARGPLHGSISWDQIDSVGAVFGQATVQIAGDTYKVRLMTGGQDNPSTAPGGEWNDLLYPLTNGTWANLTYADIGRYGNHAWTWCMETDGYDSSNRVMRGGYQTLSYYSSRNKSVRDYSLWRPVLELVQ